MLNKNDLKFILYKTRLPLKQLLNLIEEERDFELVIDSIASNLTIQDIKLLPDLSDKMRVKLALYHSSKETDYDIAEKSFVSDILSKNYKQIYTKAYLPVKGQKPVIKQFISVINNNALDNKKLNEMICNFNKIGKREVGIHLKNWIEIVNKTKEFIKQKV